MTSVQAVAGGRPSAAIEVIPNGGALGAEIRAGDLRSLSDAENAATYGQQVDNYDSARSKRLVAVLLGLGGAAALGVGVYHYKTKQQDRGVAVIPLRDGGLISWGTDF